MYAHFSTDGGEKMDGRMDGKTYISSPPHSSAPDPQTAPRSSSDNHTAPASSSHSSHPHYYCSPRAHPPVRLSDSDEEPSSCPSPSRFGHGHGILSLGWWRRVHWAGECGQERRGRHGDGVLCGTINTVNKAHEQREDGMATGHW